MDGIFGAAMGSSEAEYCLLLPSAGSMCNLNSYCPGTDELLLKGFRLYVWLSLNQIFLWMLVMLHHTHAP